VPVSTAPARLRRVCRPPQRPPPLPRPPTVTVLSAVGRGGKGPSTPARTPDGGTPSQEATVRSAALVPAGVTTAAEGARGGEWGAPEGFMAREGGGGSGGCAADAQGLSVAAAAAAPAPRK